MKTTTLLFTALLLNLHLFAQKNEHGIPLERQAQLDTLLLLLKTDRVSQLADRVSYPIARENPVPDIETKEEFMLFYPVLFDAEFKKLLLSTIFDSTNTIDHYTGFGLLRGAIWLDDEGKIRTINHTSKQEDQLAKQLQNETQQRIHSSVEDWKYNILVCETSQFIIRIDEMENDEIRYISWNKPKTISDKPALILFGGTTEIQGTMGGVTYTFKNGDYTYEIDRVQMAESQADTGLFLRVYQKGKRKKNVRCDEIK